MLHLAAKAFWPGAGAVPGAARRHRTQLPRGPRLPRRDRGAAGPAARGGQRAGLHRRRPAAGARRRHPQPAADPAAAGRDRRAPLRRRLRRRPPRRGQGPRQGAHPVACATSSASGTRATSARSCGTCTTAATPPGQHVRAFPISNWTELDIWRYIERENIELPSLYYAHEREVYRRDGMWRAVGPVSRARAPDEAVERPHRALPHRRRHVLHRRRRSPTPPPSRDVVREVAASDPHRARRHPRRRPHLRGRHGRPQEGRVLLMTDALLARPLRRHPVPLRHRRLRRRRQVHPGRAGCCTTPRRSSPTSSTPSRAPRPSAASAATAADSTWRC